MSNKVNLAYAHTDQKEYQNLLALTGNGAVKEIIYGSGTVDFGSLVDAAGETASITVPGVALGDIVLGVSLGVDLVDMTLTAYVQAANTVELRLQNESGSTADLASTTARVLIADVT